MTDNIDILHNQLEDAREVADWHLNQAKWHASQFRRWQRIAGQFEDVLPGLVEAEDVAAAAWGKKT